MRYVFLALVSGATVVGSMCIEEPQAEAFKIQAMTLEAIGQAREYISENPKQLTGSALTMFASTIIWFVVLRVIRDSKQYNKVYESTKKDQTIVDDRTLDFTNPIVEKIKNRQMVERLEQERVILIGRSKWLPDEVKKAQQELQARESDAIHAEMELANAELRREKAERKLQELVAEQNNQTADLVNIDLELKRLKVLI